MAKELPYFRFTVQEWQNGDISIESYELKGLFIDVCSFYWVKDCSIAIAMLEKRFKHDKDLLEQLIQLDIIKVDEEGKVNIDFLNEQFDLLSDKRLKRQQAGKLGGLAKSSNAKAMQEQKGSYKDKDKDKDKNNNRAFVADVNKDSKGYRKYLYENLIGKPASKDQLFLKCKIDVSRRNEIWEDFINNATVHTPLIEDEKHAWNTFKKFIQDNSEKYKIGKRLSGTETFEGFG